MPSSSSVGTLGSAELRVGAATASAFSRPAVDERKAGRRIEHVVDLARDQRGFRRCGSLVRDVQCVDHRCGVEHHAEQMLRRARAARTEVELAGLCFASATRSCGVFADEFAGTTRKLGTVYTRATGAKSLIGSKPRLS